MEAKQQRALISEIKGDPIISRSLYHALAWPLLQYF